MACPNDATTPPADHGDPCAPSLAAIKRRHRFLMAQFELLGMGDCNSPENFATLTEIDEEMQRLEIQAAGMTATTPEDHLFKLGLSFARAEGQATDETIDPRRSADAEDMCRYILAEVERVCTKYSIKTSSVIWLPVLDWT